MSVIEAVVTIAAAGAQNFETHRGRIGQITLNPKPTAIVTYSRVNGMDATAHDTESTVVLGAGVFTTVPIDWPFFRVSVTVDTCDVAIV